MEKTYEVKLNEYESIEADAKRVTYKKNGIEVKSIPPNIEIRVFRDRTNHLVTVISAVVFFIFVFDLFTSYIRLSMIEEVVSDAFNRSLAHVVVDLTVLIPLAAILLIYFKIRGGRIVLESGREKIIIPTDFIADDAEELAEKLRKGFEGHFQVYVI